MVKPVTASMSMRNPKNTFSAEVKTCLIDVFLGAGFPKGWEYIFLTNKQKNLTLMVHLIPIKFFFRAISIPSAENILLIPSPRGNLVNLSCETKLPSEKPGLQLYFSFYGKQDPNEQDHILWIPDIHC